MNENEKLLDVIRNTDIDEIESQVEVFDHNPAEIEEAQESFEKIQYLFKVENMTNFELGKELYFFKEEKKWKKLGYESFVKFLVSNSFKKTTAYRYINVYHNLVIKLEIPEEILPEIPIRKLDKLLTIVADDVNNYSNNKINKSNVDEWIEKVKLLSESDLIEEINEIKGISNNAKENEEVDGFVRGYYKLIKVDGLSFDDIQGLKNKKIKCNAYKNDDDEFFIEVI